MHRTIKLLFKILLGLVALLLLVLAAWVASNGRWADAAPQPVPAELLPQAVTLAPADNAFFDGQGLRAPEGEAPNAWGQRAWRGETGDAPLLTAPSGEDWNCNASKTDCMARWRAAAVALAAQMAQAKTFGERCKALAARSGFQEPIPMRRPRPADGKHYEAVPLPQFGPLTTCMRWLHIEAVLAPDAQRAQTAWAQADALLRLFASGTQTLIGQAVAWSWATRHQLLLAQWSAQQPPGYALPVAWLVPLPPRILQPRVWMASESQFQRETTADLTEHGGQMYGYLPERTVQAITGYWMADMRLFGHLQGPALVRQVRSQPESEASWWRYLRWRNTVGQILVEVARPGYGTYALRQADLVLYQAALDLSQQLKPVPAAERAVWWARQPMDAGVRERLSLEGDALLIRTWRGETDKDYAAPVRFPLRPA